MWLFGTEDWWSDGWRTPEEREAARAPATTGAAVYPIDSNAGANPAATRPEDRRLHG